MPFVTLLAHGLITTTKGSESVGTEKQLCCSIEGSHNFVYLILDLPLCRDVYGYCVIIVYI